MAEEGRRKKSFGQSSDAVLWKVAKSIGGKFPAVKPLLTYDKLHFIVLTSLSLKVYLLETKQCLSSIALDGGDVSDLYLDDDENVWVAHSSGKCEIYNWRSREMLRRVDFHIPLLRIIKLVSKTRAVVLVGRAGGMELVNMTLSNKEWQSEPIFAVPNSTLFVVSNKLTHFAFYAPKKQNMTITVGRLDKDFNLVSHKELPRNRNILSLAVSDSGILAAGSVSGAIDVYYDAAVTNSSDTNVISPPRALKWHVDEVLALSFSLNGEYLLSGGKERVLVFWQLETGNLQFLPRLYGDIRNIYVDPLNEFYALSLKGDQVLLLSALDLVSRLQITGIKAEFAKPPGDPEKERRKRKKVPTIDKIGDYTAEYYTHPTTGHLYFPLKGAQIQIYDPIKDEEVNVISVANTIQTGKVRKELLIKDPVITGLCFSIDGKWMVTVDEREAPAIDNLLSRHDKEINLKFWQYKDLNNQWQLVTRIASPHGVNNSVVDIVAADRTYSNGHAFLTACHQGGIRLWRLKVEREAELAKAPRLVWGVRKVLPPTGLTTSSVSIAWSPDSSLILLGIESTVHVIDAAKFEYKSVLPNIAESRIRQLAIVGSHLVILSKTRLVSWDLINGCQSWSAIAHSPTNGRRLFASDGQNQTIALGVNYFSKDYRVVSKVLIFGTQTPLPIHVENYNTGIGNVQFIPNTRDLSVLDVRGRVSSLVYANAAQVIEKPKETLDTLYHRRITFASSSAIEEEDEEDIDVPDSTVVLNVHSFDKVFDGTEYDTNNLEALFDKVLQVLSPRKA
jgi:NET1-associated nuclear protein 1 (U3 small nucleolar RNA-associated protein 17)